MGDTMSKIETTDNITASYVHKLHRWRMAFFGVIILFAGIVIGAASMMILVPERVIRPPRGPEFNVLRTLPSLQRDLGLSDEQLKEIEPVFSGRMEELRGIRENARVEITKILEQMNSEISSLLTEEQKNKWQGELERLQGQLRPGNRRRGEGLGAGPRRGRGNEAVGPRRGNEAGEPVRDRGRQERLRRGQGLSNSSQTTSEPNTTQERIDGNTPE